MNSEKINIEYSTLSKYFDNRASAGEIDQVKEWLADKDRNYKCEKYLHNLWNEFDPGMEEPDIDFDALLGRIYHTIQIRSFKRTKVRKLTPGSESKATFKYIIRNFSRIAAIFLAPVLFYIGWQIYSDHKWETRQANVVYNEIKTPLGAQSTFELPDGTRGKLNNGSTLKYPVKFIGENREVELKGEVFLDVEHEKRRPFIVHTSGLDVKVLGTRLNIYSYPEEKYQEITLESGSVELIQKQGEENVTVAGMKPGQHVVYKYGGDKNNLGPKIREKDLLVVEDKDHIDRVLPDIISGKQALYRTGSGDLYMEYTDTENYTGWTEGKLILRNDPMPVLLKRIERWYSVKFNIMDERINAYTYWATFEEENLEEVLRLLSFTAPVKFKMLPRKKMEDGTYKIQEIEVTLKK